MFDYLDYVDIKYPVSKNDCSRIEKDINVTCYKNDLFYPVHVSDVKFEKCMDLLLMADENKSHYICIKDFERFICNKIKK